MLKSRLPEVMAELKPRIDAALKAGAEAVEAEAKARVHRRSGELHDAIHIQKGGGGYYVVAGDDKAFYGHMVEHGTTHSPPFPFLMPALEGKRSEIEAGVGVVLRSL